MSDWCTIESDPGVFTALIRDIGVKNVSVEEVWSLDDESFIDSLKPIYGFIFLFKWTNKIEPRECLNAYDSELFFARQVIVNACATQSILSVLLNCRQIDIGEELTNFKLFTNDLDSQMKGLTIGNSEKIKSVHNNFARPEPFLFTNDKKGGKGKDDVFHFISYVPFKDKLYELDGLQPAPILLGSFDKENDWIEIAKNEINKRILKYSQNEIRFNLMAVVASKKSIAEEKLNNSLAKKMSIYKSLFIRNIEIDINFKDEYELLKTQNIPINEDFIKEINETNPEELKNILMDLSSEIKQCEMVVHEEIEKSNKYEIENARRKHNYIPFILELLKLTAKKGKLEELIEEAKKKKKEKAEKQQEAKEKTQK